VYSTKKERERETTIEVTGTDESRIITRREAGRDQELWCCPGDFGIRRFYSS